MAGGKSRAEGFSERRGRMLPLLDRDHLESLTHHIGADATRELLEEGRLEVADRLRRLAVAARPPGAGRAGLSQKVIAASLGNGSAGRAGGEAAVDRRADGTGAAERRTAHSLTEYTAGWGVGALASGETAVGADGTAEQADLPILAHQVAGLAGNLGMALLARHAATVAHGQGNRAALFALLAAGAPSLTALEHWAALRLGNEHRIRSIDSPRMTDLGGACSWAEYPACPEGATSVSFEPRTRLQPRIRPAPRCLPDSPRGVPPDKLRSCPKVPKQDQTESDLLSSDGSMLSRSFSGVWELRLGPEVRHLPSPNSSPRPRRFRPALRHR